MLLRYLVAAQQDPSELPSPFTGPSTQSTGDASLGCNTSSPGDHVLQDSSSSPQILPLQHFHLESQMALQEDATEREEKQDGLRGAPLQQEAAGGRKELERSSNLGIPRGRRRGWRFPLHPWTKGGHSGPGQSLRPRRPCSQQSLSDR